MSDRVPSRRIALLGLWASLGAAGLAGCLELRDQPEEDAVVAQCTPCHGDAKRDDGLRSSAPPIDLLGATDPSYPGVGAHSIHLDGSSTHGPFACDTCHIVPETVDAPGHDDTARPAELVFGGIATVDDHDPKYNVGARTCADSYCHGSARAVWTRPRSSADACGTCHALPPPAPHPAFDACHLCHGDVIDAENEFVAPELHVDGKVQLSFNECTDCHGSGDDPAPPVDTRGNDSVSAIGVGAHQIHVGGTENARAVECDECHVVPEGIDEPQHLDGVAEVTFSGVASASDRMPTWDRDAATCGSTWCHGPTEERASPLWTEPGDLGCDGCHGAPPAAPHPDSDRCADCHGAVVGPDFQIRSPELHVDGVVELADAECDTCHGSTESPAPPLDLDGEADEEARGVGAHSVHLAGGDHSSPVACDACHVVPESLTDPGHLTGRPADLIFSGVAVVGEREPNYDYSAATCAETWCHGPSGGGLSPAWTDAQSLSCTACHGSPPVPPHPQIADCPMCHAEVVSSPTTIIAPMLHVNGTVEVEVDPDDCTACHGSSEGPAPPVDLAGNTAVTEPGVGAHQTHLLGTERSRAVPCATCHIVPDEVLDPGHMDTGPPAEVVFSGGGLAFGAEPVYEGGRCAATPCHGAVFPKGHASGGSNTEPLWAAPAGTEARCGACHALPPGRPHPVADLNPVCSACHQNIEDDNLTFTRPDLHVDGEVTFDVP